VAGIAGLMVERRGSAGLIRRYQTARLRALLRHSYERVPFYRRRFDEAGFHPDDFHTLDDLGRVPMTRKSDLRLVTGEDAIATDCDGARLNRYGTGGSTGTPTEVRFTRFEDRLLRLFRVQANRSLGLRWSDRRCTILASGASGAKSRLERLGILRSLSLSIYAPWEENLARLRAFRPDVIRGYGSLLAVMANRMTDEDRRTIRPRFITTDSEALTELARMQIEAGFQAPVFDIYDCFECNVIAYQCRQSEMYHTMDASLVVEVLDEAGRPVGAGECGEVAFTSLHGWAAPLIRYMPGDVVDRGPDVCACGSAHSVVAKVHGRVQDRFHLPDGRVFNVKLLTSFIYPLCPLLRLYQLVQEARDLVVVRLQPIPGVSIREDKLEELRRGLLSALGEGVTLMVQVVDEIASEPNGKFRPYRSHIPRIASD